MKLHLLKTFFLAILFSSVASAHPVFKKIKLTKRSIKMPELEKPACTLFNGDYSGSCVYGGEKVDLSYKFVQENCSEIEIDDEDVLLNGSNHEIDSSASTVVDSVSFAKWNADKTSILLSIFESRRDLKSGAYERDAEEKVSFSLDSNSNLVFAFESENVKFSCNLERQSM